MPEQLPVFVYGTLRPGQPNYARFLVGRTEAEELADAGGLVMHSLGSYPVASPGPSRVHGHLVTLRPRSYHRVLSSLDALEGFTGQPETSFYVRRTWSVHLPRASARTAWIYLAGPDTDVTGLTRVESGDWLSRSAGRTSRSKERSELRVTRR